MQAKQRLSQVVSALSPRRSLRVRVGLAFGGLILLLALLLTLLIERPAEIQLEDDIGNTLASLALQLVDTVERDVLERVRDVQTLASLSVMRDPQVAPSARQNLLDDVRQTYSDYLWLGLVDEQGIVTASSGPLPAGSDVSALRWYTEGRRAAFAGEVAAPLLPGAERVLALAAPVVDSDGAVHGVVAAYLDWARVAAIPASWFGTTSSMEATDVFLLDEEGDLLFTTANTVSDNLQALASVTSARREENGYVTETWPDGESYLTGYTRVNAVPGLEWVVLVRQPLRVAYGSILQLQQQILFLGAGLGLLFLLLGWWLAGRMVQPLAAIAEAAERIRRGERGTEIPDVGGTDEVGLLSRSLRRLVAELTAQQRALEESQQVLEDKVIERTRTLAAVYRVLEVASTAEDLQMALDRALEPVLAASGAAAGFVHLLPPGGNALQLQSHLNVPAHAVSTLQVVPVGEGHLGRVLRERQPAVVDDVGDDARLAAFMQAQRMTAFAAVPVIAGNRVLGVLGVASRTSFSRETIELLASVGEELGVVVENARLQRRDEELAVLEERNRLARELHDSVTQSLYSVTLYAEAARRLLLAGDTERTADYLSRLGDTGHQALKEMRLLLHKLRPLALQQEGLVSALRHRLDAVEGRVGIKHSLQVEGHIDLSPGIEEALYHISQEALNNALKHADATEIVVLLQAGEEGDIELVVTDNGSGFEVDEVDGAGMGLTTMRERAQRFGGDVVIDSVPGQGTTVRVRLASQQESAGKAPVPQVHQEPLSPAQGAGDE